MSSHTAPAAHRPARAIVSEGIGRRTKDKVLTLFCACVIFEAVLSHVINFRVNSKWFHEGENIFYIAHTSSVPG